MKRIVKTISIERSVFEALEKIRGNRQQFTSQYINEALKEKLGLTRTPADPSPVKVPAVPAKEAASAAAPPLIGETA